MVSFVAIVPEVNPEMVFPVPPILISPTFTCVAESVPLIVAADAVSPDVVRLLAIVPPFEIERPVDEIVAPVSEVPATTVPDVVSPESVRVEAPVVSVSAVTEVKLGVDEIPYVTVPFS